MIGSGPPPSVFVIIAVWHFPHRMPFKVAAMPSRLSAHDLHRVTIASQGPTTFLRVPHYRGSKLANFVAKAAAVASTVPLRSSYAKCLLTNHQLICRWHRRMADAAGQKATKKPVIVQEPSSLHAFILSNTSIILSANPLQGGVKKC